MKRLLITAAMLVATPALAHDEEFATAFREDAREVRLIGARYGDYVVRKEAKSADAFIAMYASDTGPSAQRDRLLARVSDSQCLIDSAKGFGDVQMRFPADIMRYALADALFRAQLATAPVPAGLATLPGLAHPVLNEAGYQPKPGKRLSSERMGNLAERRDREMARIYLSQFGVCVVRTDPEGAKTLLSTKVVTPEENAAFGKLNSALGQCVSGGSKVELNKAVLRGTVALNHHRLARQQATSAAARTGQK